MVAPLLVGPPMDVALDGVGKVAALLHQLYFVVQLLHQPPLSGGFITSEGSRKHRR